MAISKSMQRLLRIREMEEEQSRRSLEAALTEQNRLEHARDAAVDRDREGRASTGAAILSGDLVGRQAGLVQSQTASRSAQMLAPRVATSEIESARRRAQLLEKRMERDQAARLIEQSQAQEKLESERQAQRITDDCYGARRYHRNGGEQSR